MTEIKEGNVPRSAELIQDYTYYIVSGDLSGSGIQYSAIASFGTTAVEILNQLIDPNIGIGLKQLEMNLSHRFTEVSNGTTLGSLMYYWRARSEWKDPIGTQRTTSWVNLTGTLGKGVASGANWDETVSGYTPIGSVPAVPLRISLMAQALYAGGFKGRVKNDSFVRMIGTIIPGA